MEINRLPGIGSKTALRLALHLLRQDESRVEALADSLVEMRRGVHYCQICYNICDDERCEICSNPSRDSSLVCVVENVQDVWDFALTKEIVDNPLDFTIPEENEKKK